MKKKMQVLAALLSLALISIGCSRQDSAQAAATSPTNPASSPTETVTLRYLAPQSGSPFFIVATELGFAKEAGIKFENVGTTTGGPYSVQALVAGDIELGSSNISPIINAFLAGHKLKLVVATSVTKSFDEQGQPAFTTGWIVREDSGIKGPQDLVGKRIAVNTLGAYSDYVIRKWLRDANIPRDQVELVVIGQEPARALQVFQQGEVDVISGGPETLEKLKALGIAVRVFPDSEILGDTNMATGGVFVSEDLIKNHPDVVRRFVQAYVKAYDWSRGNLAEYKRIVEKVATENREEMIDPAAVAHYSASYREHALLTDDDMNFWINELIADGKLTPGQVKPSDLYTNEFNPYYQGNNGGG